VWLPHSSLGFRALIGRRSYHNKPRLRGEVYVTPQATIAQKAIVACITLYIIVKRIYYLWCYFCIVYYTITQS